MGALNRLRGSGTLGKPVVYNRNECEIINTMNRVLKYILGIIVVLLMSVLVSYLSQIFILVSLRFVRSASLTIGLLIICALLIVLVSTVFCFGCKRRSWLSESDGLAVICISAVLYTAFMWSVFPHITVPYELIPNAEMGFGFMQLLIQIFCSIGAGLCFLVSGIICLCRR